MGVPAFLATSHRYLSTGGVTDTNNIITQFRSETVTYGSPSWTEPTTAVFKSPVDADGRWFDVYLTCPSTTRLQCRVRDHLGATIATRELAIDAGGTTIRIMTGEAHFCIQAARSTPEELAGGLLDLTPEGQAAHAEFVWAKGKRNSSGTDDGYGRMDCTATSSSGINYNKQLHAFYDANGYMRLTTPTGYAIVFPAYIINGSNQVVGRLCQFYIVPSSISAGSAITLPIDVATTAAFRVLGFVAIYSACLAVRAD